MPQTTEYSASAGIYPSAPKPVIHNATSSCARLCPNAPQTPMKTGVNFVFFHSMPMMSVLKSPPQRLISPAETPRVKNANRPLIATMNSAAGRPIAPAANMVTRFESPAFAPGGMPGSGGRRFSRIPSTSASAPNSPMSAMCSVFFFMDVLSVLRCFFLRLALARPFKGPPNWVPCG